VKILMLLSKDFSADPRDTKESKSLVEANHEVSTIDCQRLPTESKLGLPET